jgi:hypothetical protein
MREAGDYSAANTVRYQRRWVELYGHDFGLSTAFANLIYRYPIIMDAMASEVKRKGDVFMSKWCASHGFCEGGGGLHPSCAGLEARGAGCVAWHYQYGMQDARAAPYSGLGLCALGAAVVATLN